MPVAYTGASLPWQLLTTVRYASLHVPHHGFLVHFLEDFARHNDFRLSCPILLNAVIVIVLKDIETNLVVTTPEWKDCIVKVNDAGAIFVDTL